MELDHLPGQLVRPLRGMGFGGEHLDVDLVEVDLELLEHGRVVVDDAIRNGVENGRRTSPRGLLGRSLDRAVRMWKCGDVGHSVGNAIGPVPASAAAAVARAIICTERSMPSTTSVAQCSVTIRWFATARTYPRAA